MRVLIWDLPTRLFHWLLVAAFIVAWLTSDDARYTDVHLFAGYLIAGLLVFRLLWGLIGGNYARFSHLFRSPRAVFRQLGGESAVAAGHNPAGGWAIAVMLVLLLAVCLTGFVVLGGEEGFGPLAGLFDVPGGIAFHRWHELLVWLLLSLVGLHVAAVIVESIREQQNLLMAMVSGYKRFEEPPKASAAHTLTGLVMLAAVIAGALFHFRGYLAAPGPRAHEPFPAEPMSFTRQWRSRCGECHLAFHPVLLPARSWRKLLEENNGHFGEDLQLDAEAVADLWRFASNQAAERHDNELGVRTRQVLSAVETPVRITRSRYWVLTHRDIPATVWRSKSLDGKHDCAACHRDAERGTFMNGAMRVVE